MKGYQPISDHDGSPLVPPPKNPRQPTRSRIRANVGDYVLATKYGDGHAGDNWVVGVVKEIVEDEGYTWCRCWTEFKPDDVRRYRRAVRLKSNDEGVYIHEMAKFLEHFNPSRSLYSVLGEFRKRQNFHI
jgi:hypothetical protein